MAQPSSPPRDYEADDTAVMPMAEVVEAMPISDKALSRSSISRGRGGRGERVRQTSLGLFEPGYYSRPRFADSSLPAVVAGGLDYVYACPTKVSIPSSGERMSVPLSVEVYPAQTFYEATPSLKKTAYLKAEVENKGARPILGGPVNIFMGGDFAGQGRLNTTGPGGKLSLPLGADEDIRLKRTVVPKTNQEGVFSKDDVTEYVTTIEVGNYKRRAVKVSIIDQVPTSGKEEIEIETGKLSPKPDARADGKTDPDGIQRWTVELPAGGTKTIEFKYKITRPANWQLHQ